MSYKIIFKTFDENVFREDIMQANCSLSFFKEIEEAKSQAMIYLTTFFNFDGEPEWIVIPSSTFKFGCFVASSETRVTEVIVEIK